MPSFSKKEIRNLLVIGVVALVLGLLMVGIGQRGLSREFGVPEYMTVLRNSGVTLATLSLLWLALALYRKPLAR